MIQDGIEICCAKGWNQTSIIMDLVSDGVNTLYFGSKCAGAFWYGLSDIRNQHSRTTYIVCNYQLKA
jgi:hypothetical protein